MNSIRMKEVAARVVAWHNRHPLAQRISLGQVDGIGVIALPFVTASERAGGAVRADLVAPRVVVEPSFEPPVLDESVSVIESAMAGQAPGPGEEGAEPPAPDTAPKTRLRDRAAAQSGEEAVAPAEASPAAPFEPALPAWHPKAWVKALRRWLPGSRTGFQSVFSEDFIAPTSPKQVARWALTHGSTTWPGETHWPRREIAPDAAMLSRAMNGAGVEPVTLYVVTAAIVTNKGRMRVLVGRDGRAIGPREFSLMRILMAGVLAAGLAGAGAWLLWGPKTDPQDLTPGAAASAPAAVEAASAAASVTPPKPTLLIASDLEPPPAASGAAASHEAGHGAAHGAKEPAPEPATALIMDKSMPAVTPAPVASAPAAVPAPPVAARPRPPSPNQGKLAAMGAGMGISEEDKQAALAEGRRMRASDPKPSTVAPPARPEPTPAPVAKAAPTPTPAPAPAPAPISKKGEKTPPPAAEPEAEPSGKPKASELGLNDASARQSGATGPKGQRFYALVSKSSFTKVEADARMVQLRSAAANAIAPAGTRIEVIQARNAWQAVWWPFTKRDDAERARGLLAARGVTVDVVEF